MSEKISKYKYLYCLSIIALLFSTLCGYAQNADIHELENKNQGTDRSDFYNLAFNLHPTIYFQNQKKKVHTPNKSPLKLNLTGVSALKNLQNVDFDARKVELINICLNTPQDLNTILDITHLAQFKNLKYLFIKCSFNTSVLNIKHFITTNSNTKIRVFYKIEIPS